MSIQKLVLCLHCISKPSVAHKSHSSLYSSEWIFKSSVLDFICSTSHLSIPSVLCLRAVTLSCARQWQYLVLEPQVDAGSFPSGITECARVWSGSALSTYGFIYSRALNFYLSIDKQLRISGHPVWNFSACSRWVAEKTSTCVSAAGPGPCSLAPWCGLALWCGWQHPPQTGLPLHREAVLGPMCWASTSTMWLGSDKCPWEKGRHEDMLQWEGTCVSWCGGGCRGRGWSCSLQMVLAYAFIYMFHGKFSKEQQSFSKLQEKNSL